MLIAAAYSTPTAGNRQTNVYAVVTEGIDELRLLCAESLKVMSDDVKANPENYSNIVKVYAKKWEAIYKDVFEKDFVTIREQKTEKYKQFPLRDDVKEVLNTYCKNKKFILILRRIIPPFFKTKWNRNRFKLLSLHKIYIIIKVA